MKNRNRGSRVEKKKWLLRYSELKQEVNREADQAGYWKDKAYSLSSPALENYGIASANKLGMSDYVVQFLDLAEECSKLGKEAELKKQEINKAIDNIEDIDCRMVLKYKYIDGLDFCQIAKKMHYSLNWIWQLHGKALDYLDI